MYEHRNETHSSEVMKCIEKIYDAKGKIIGYKLEYTETGNTKYFGKDALKLAMRNSWIEVTNLTLTSNNKLVSKNKTVKNQNDFSGFADTIAKKIFLDLGYEKYMRKIEVVYNRSSERQADKRYGLRGKVLMLSGIYRDGIIGHIAVMVCDGGSTVYLSFETDSEQNYCSVASTNKRKLNRDIEKFVAKIEGHVGIYSLTPVM